MISCWVLTMWIILQYLTDSYTNLMSTSRRHQEANCAPVSPFRTVIALDLHPPTVYGLTSLPSILMAEALRTVLRRVLTQGA